MKKQCVLFLAVIVFSPATFAQKNTKILLKAGESVEKFKKEHVYRYPEFKDARVVYKDANVLNGQKLNYNQMSERMEFIDAKGDTLEITNYDLISYITIGGDTFVCNRNYYELVGQVKDVKLARRTALRTADRQKIGAMGRPTSTAAIGTYDRVQDSPYYIKLQPNINYVFTQSVMYFFADGKNNFMPANERNLLKLVPNHQKEVKQYIADQNISFTTEEDLNKLLGYLNTL